MVSIFATVLTLLVAADAPVEDVAQVIQVNGQASVIHGDNQDGLVPLDLGAKLHAGDKLNTLSHSWVRLILADNSVLDLAPDTAMSLEGFRRTSEAHFLVRLRAYIGKLWVHAAPREADGEFVVTTANAVVEVRGTSFVVDTTDADVSVISVAMGHVTLSPGYLLGDAQPTDLFAMQAATVQGTNWPPVIAPLTAETLQEMNLQIPPGPTLDSASQYERLERVQSQTGLRGGVSHAANLPLQWAPSTTPGTVPSPLNLDQGARPSRVEVTVQIQP